MAKVNAADWEATLGDLCSAHTRRPRAATTGRPYLNLVLHMLFVRMQLADTDCTLGDLRALAIISLAEERTRKNGAPEQRLGHRSNGGSTDGGADGDGWLAGAGQR